MKKVISILLLAATIFGFSVQVYATSADKVSDTIESVGKYLYETVKAPTVSSIGGEWTVTGLARSNIDIPKEYFENYYKNVEKYVKEKNGVLHNKKYTEYSRVVIALTAIGKDPENVAGYNLLAPLGDYEKTVFQGINGAVWALIALDCGNYAIPKNTSAKTQATREMYVTYILKRQLSDGGWALSGEISDPDVTAMVLQALSKYQDNDNVKSATEKALSCLSSMQNENGGFFTYNEETSESSVQVLVALCELGISADDKRFVKNGNTILNNLLSFYDGKGFKHIHEDSTNLMATEQCFYALVALDRMNEGKNSLYSMSDVRMTKGSDSSGLVNKNPDVKKMPVLYNGKTFDDIKISRYKTQIEALASRGIINGKTNRVFEPESTMTRAEFATIITRSLGLEIKEKDIFKDVRTSDWFYPYVGTAFSYGIVNGVSESKFDPNGTITREEASAMVSRAAKLCGHNTHLTTNKVRNILSAFSDTAKTSDWAKESLAFCYSKGILDSNTQKINPKECVTRAEIASMLYNILNISNLL